MRIPIKSRWAAFGTHLTISFIIFIVLTMIILFKWYPGAYKYLGGIEAIFLIAGVDLTIGPIMTLLIFDINKKGLKSDLAIIACMQISALIYGAWSVEQGRPLIQVLSYDGIYVISKSDLAKKPNLAKFASNENYPFPIEVYLDLPQNTKDISIIEVLSNIVDGVPLQHKHEFYVKFRNHSEPDLPILNDSNHDIVHHCFLVEVNYRDIISKACISKSTGKIEYIQNQS